MFDARLKALLTVLAVVALILVVRLGQLQIVRAAHYRQRAERALVLRPITLPFVRGDILDRRGETLVREEPCWHVAIDYSVIAAEFGDDPEVSQVLPGDLDRMWQDLSQFASSFRPLSVEELRGRAKRVFERVSSIRRAVSRRRGFDAPVAEEHTAHGIITGLDARQQVAAREGLARLYPWIRVETSSQRRVLGDGVPLAHVIGRLGRVDAKHVANDPQADDPFAKYRADEKLGISGVERAAERRLRGRRGQRTKDRGGHLVADGCFDAQDGGDVVLSLDADLQRQLYALLGETVDREVEASGGSLVVLDVASREVLALVSYPSYDPSRFQELYTELRNDTDRLPLRFRAVANRYAPGSTVKPLTCLTGLMTETIALDTYDECGGYLFPDVRDRWRCWRVHGTRLRKAHGMIDVVEALTGSCNVFMYRLGERIGVNGLCNAFDMVGIGRRTGTGLSEEVGGINPTPGWLMTHKNIRATAGTARLFAIGQGELSMTPIQVANLMATYASGRYRPVTLIRTSEETPEWTITASPAEWSAIRRGIYGVVNDPEGTAYKYAHFDHERFALCGKTGSATAHPWPTAYRIPFVDKSGVESVAVVRAGAKGRAIERFKAEHPHAVLDVAYVEVATRWPPLPPPSDEKYSHAWFGGYLQPLDALGQPDWSRTPPVAFAVMIEFGGSGGRTTGPLARQLAGTLADLYDGSWNEVP